MGATFDPELMQRVGEAIGREAKVQGIRMSLAPDLDLGREPRGDVLKKPTVNLPSLPEKWVMRMSPDFCSMTENAHLLSSIMPHTVLRFFAESQKSALENIVAGYEAFESIQWQMLYGQQNCVKIIHSHDEYHQL